MVCIANVLLICNQKCNQMLIVEHENDNASEIEKEAKNSKSLEENDEFAAESSSNTPQLNPERYGPKSREEDRKSPCDGFALRSRRISEGVAELM